MVAVWLLAALAGVDPPVKGRPEDFVGVVGRFSLTAVVRPDRFRLDESAMLILELQGVGNLSNARPPDLAKSPSFAERFDVVGPPKRSLEPSKARFEYLIRARSAQVKSVPSVRLSIYDDSPPRPGYRLLRSSEIPVEVTPVDSGDVVSSAEATLGVRSGWSFRSLTPFVAALIVALIGLLAIRRRGRRFSQGGAERTDDDRLKRERRKRPADRPAPFNRIELESWLDRFGEALSLPPSRRTSTEIAAAAARLGLDQDIVKALGRNLFQIDQVRFGTGPASNVDEASLQTAVDAIDELTKRLGGATVSGPP